MKLKILADGGEMKPGPVISQKLGPLGINLGKLITDVNKETSSFKGMKVPVEIDIGKDKSYKIKIFSPPTSQLIKKELGIEKASGDHKKLKAGNLSIEQVISIAKTKFSNMLTRDFKSAVKSVIGTCISLGVLIENKESKETLQDVESGLYDKEIKEQKTIPSPEKIKKLKDFFENLHKKQEAAIKKEAEEAAKEAEAKAAAKVEQEKQAEAAKVVKVEEKKPEAKK